MAKRYAQRLIERVRRATVNEGATATSGLTDQHFLDYINDAIDDLVDEIVTINPEYFTSTQTASLVAGQRDYSLAGDILNNNAVKLLEYSCSGDTDDYRPVKLISPKEASSVEVDSVSGYFVRDGKVVISPVPSTSTGTIRATVIARPPVLDIRRGKIASDTDTTITLAASPTPDDGLENLDDGEYICIVDDFGNIQHSALACTDFDSGTRVITGTFTGLTIDANDWVVLGEYANTHVTLPRAWERYLVKYAAREIIAVEESSLDTQVLDAMLVHMGEQIMDSVWASMEGGQHPPMTNPRWT